MKRENNNKHNLVTRVFLFSNMATAGRNFSHATVMKTRIWGNAMLNYAFDFLSADWWRK